MIICQVRNRHGPAACAGLNVSGGLGRNLPVAECRLASVMWLCLGVCPNKLTYRDADLGDAAALDRIGG